MSRYSAIVMDHFDNPRNGGRMEGSHLVGSANLHGAAPHMSIYLRVRDEVVERVMFQTFGCGAAIAAGSMLTVLATNRLVAECRQITVQQLDRALGGLPAEKCFCAELAIAALQDGLAKIPPPELGTPCFAANP